MHQLKGIEFTGNAGDTSRYCQYVVQMKSCKKIHLSVVVDIVDIVDNNITLESGNL